MKNAGYEILDATPTTQEENLSFGIVLGHNEKTNMWVTWCYKRSTITYEIDYFWGHYFDREQDALIDYHRRILNDLEA